MLVNDSSNIYLLLYIASWIITFIVYWKKKKVFGTGLLIVSSYIFYAVVSFSLYNNPYAVSMFKVLTFFPFVYLFVMLLIFLQPVLKYNEKNIIQQPSISLINTISWSIVIVTLITLPSVLGHIQDGVTLILTSEEGGKDLYNEFREGEHTSYSFLNYFYALRNISSDISVLFLFNYLTLSQKNKFLMLGLLLGAFTSVLSSLADGLRTEASMKILLFFGSYFLFKEQLSTTVRRTMKTIGIVLLSFVFVVMAALTISRFSLSEGGANFQVERYIGQANLNFNNYCLDAGGIRYGDRTCNVFKKLLLFDNVPNDIMSTRAKYSKMKINDGSFYTFVGDFALDFGPIFGALILIIFSILFCLLTKPKKRGKILFHQLILVYFVMSVCIQGGMYMFYYSFKMNYVIIAYFLFYLLFRWDYNKLRAKGL